LVALGVCIVMVLRASSTREREPTGSQDRARQHALTAR
jgi:hypothetical protein